MRNLENVKFDIIGSFTAVREMRRIWEYISKDLYNPVAMKSLRKNVKTKIKNLNFSPKIYAEINKLDDLKRRYRRIPVKNYLLLYTIDDDSRVVYVSHMYYERRNYIDI